MSPFAHLDLVNVTGKFLLFQGGGNAAQGTVTFTPSVILTDVVANEIIYPTVFIATLNILGSFSIQLPATTDPDLYPTGWTYLVTETIAGSTLGRSYNIELPYDLVGNTIDLADIPHVTAVGEISQFQSRAEKNVPGGYAGLTSMGFILPGQLGSGTRDGTRFLRDDGTFQVPPGVGGGSGSLIVQDENGNIAADVTQIDFQGAGVVASLGTGEVVVTVPGSLNPLTVQDENGNVGTSVTRIDFVGSGVTASAGTGEVVVNIPGSSGPGTASNMSGVVYTLSNMDTLARPDSEIVCWIGPLPSDKRVPANFLQGADYRIRTDSVVSAPTAPSIPAAPVGSAGNGTATWDWSAPSSGGSPITGYSYILKVGGVAGSPVTIGNTNTLTLSGLTNGTIYSLSISAINAVGSSSYSPSSNDVTPASSITVPGAPTGVSGVSGNTQVTVSWTAPASNGGAAITDYEVEYSISGVVQGTVLVGSATTNKVVTGLTNGTAYTFKVRAYNSIGAGSYSTASSAVTPSTAATAPGSPTGVTGAAGSTQVTVSWTAPASNGGAAITDYEVERSIGGSVQGTTLVGSAATNKVITGLTNGTAYTFRVRAINSVGAGSYSTASSAVTPATVPGTPTIGTAVGGNTSATVNWTAPSSNGGSAVTSYSVQPYVGGSASGSPVVVGNVTSTVISGLTNGTAYTFKVAAINAMGTGSQSVDSNAVTPNPVTATPTLVLSQLIQPDAAIFNSNSCTIPANQVSLLEIDAAGNNSNIPSISQSGVTWVHIGTVSGGVSTLPNVWVFRAAPGAAATGPITVTFDETKTSCNFTVVTVSASIATTNGADGLGVPVGLAQGSGTTISVSLAALTNANSVVIGFLRQLSAGTVTVGSGFTELSNVSGNAPSSRHSSEWKVNSTVVNYAVVSGTTRLLAVEVKSV